MKTHHELLLILQSMYNEKNPQMLKQQVSPSVIYQSQWVLEPISGSRELHAFLSRKFETMIKSKAELQATIGVSEKTGEEYIALRQGDMKEIACCVQIKCDQGRIARIDIVSPEFV